MQITESNATSQSQRRALPDSWIVKLFDELAVIYGSQFADKWSGVKPELMRQRWAEQLAGFDGAAIGGALKACYSRQFVPNLPEFAEMCRNEMKRQGTYLALEHQPTSREEARKFMAELQKRYSMKTEAVNGN